MKISVQSKSNGEDKRIEFLYKTQADFCGESLLLATLPAKEMGLGIPPLEMENQYYVFYANGEDVSFARSKKLRKIIQKYVRDVCKKEMKKTYRIISIVRSQSVAFTYAGFAMHPVAIFKVNDLNVV